MINYVYNFDMGDLFAYDNNVIYCIIEAETELFDKYCLRNSDEYTYFRSYLDCTRIVNYHKIVNEINENPDNKIVYPVLNHLIQFSQGRHRTRAIIDSKSNTIRVALKEKDFLILNNELNIKLINKFIVDTNFKIKEI